MHIQYDINVANKIGRYSDAVAVAPGARWLVTAGTPGLAQDGTLPKDFEGQARLAWDNVIRALREADMRLDDVVKVTQYLARRSDVDAYRTIRSEYLGSMHAASMLSIVEGFVWPEILIEIEIVAAKE
jgi:enamine deaminase RidA (YjgF/YER057c/UK114 family)